MSPNKLTSQEQRLQKVTSKMLAEMIIDQTVSQEDISSGVYKPVSNNASLIDIEDVVAKRKQRDARLAKSRKIQVE